MQRVHKTVVLTHEHRSGSAARCVRCGCTACVLVLNGARPSLKNMNLCVVNVIQFDTVQNTIFCWFFFNDDVKI